MSARARTRVYPGKTTSLGDKNDILKTRLRPDVWNWADLGEPIRLSRLQEPRRQIWNGPTAGIEPISESTQRIVLYEEVREVVASWETKEGCQRR